jgi:DNA-binding MarR family transcriptional regulator
MRQKTRPMPEASPTALLLLQAATEFQDRLAGELAAIHGLSVNEFLLLLVLGQAPDHGLPRSVLARRMYVSASTVTRMATPMEKTGLLARRPNARDARQALVVLTPAGRTRLAEARATFAKRAEVLFSDRWTEAELDQLGRLLGRLVSGDRLAPR